MRFAASDVDFVGARRFALGAKAMDGAKCDKRITSLGAYEGTPLALRLSPGKPTESEVIRAPLVATLQKVVMIILGNCQSHPEKESGVNKDEPRHGIRK
ncbi:hypothetical protein HG531_001040 [Fusarium graminearum]|nr:hypothetical protein HG531_001040 [Fusarium graminearum]